MLEVIECLDEVGEAQVSQIAAELDVGTSTAHRHVKTLEWHGYAVTEDKEVTLSTAFLRLGNGVRYRSGIAEPIVEGLVDEIG